MCLYGLLQGQLFCYIHTYIYIDEFPTSQETDLLTAIACHGDSFTSVYVDNLRTSQETYLWTTMLFYAHSSNLIFLI
jgi:hypothetical protein